MSEANFFKRCLRSPFSDAALILISRRLETGLKSGKDWISILKWISEHDPDVNIKIYFQSFLYRMSLETTDSFLEQEAKRFQSPLCRMFFQLLRQHARGVQNFSKLLHRFSKMAESIDQLRRRERGMLFIPKFQTGVAVCISFVFIFALPLLSQDLFPTFITLHRWDLFLGGVSFLTLGFCALHWMCRLPQRHLKPRLEVVFFLQFLSIFIESGADLVSAWYKTLDLSELDSKVQKTLKRKNLSTESMDEFLSSTSKNISAPWPELLTGVLWAKISGVGLSQFLQNASERQSEILLSLWDEEIRKLSLTTLLPLGFLIFPSVLFLLVGPQFIQLVNV